MKGTLIIWDFSFWEVGGQRGMCSVKKTIYNIQSLCLCNYSVYVFFEFSSLLIYAFVIILKDARGRMEERGYFLSFSYGHVVKLRPRTTWSLFVIKYYKENKLNFSNHHLDWKLLLWNFMIVRGLLHLSNLHCKSSRGNLQGIFWSPKCPSNTRWCNSQPSNVVDRISTWLGLAYSPHMQDQSSNLSLHTWEILPPTLYGTPSVLLRTFLNSSSESFNNFEFALNEILTDLNSSMLRCLRTSLI